MSYLRADFSLFQSLTCMFYTCVCEQTVDLRNPAEKQMRSVVAIGLLSFLIAAWAQTGSGRAEQALAEAELNERGKFSNPIGDLDKGGLGVRVPFMLRRLGTYFRSSEGAPERCQTMAACCAPT